MTNVANHGTFACRTVTTIENRYINVTFSEIWNIQMFLKFGTYQIYGYMEWTFMSMDIWTEHSIYGYMEGKFVHTNAHQIKNM